MPLKVEVAALSDIGNVRTNNEDSFGYDPDRHVYVVCDGMGGMAAGEVASQTAVSTFLQTVAASDPAIPTATTMHQAITAANDTVHKAGLLPAHRGMGTTLVTAHVDLEAAKLYIGNVGDSRAYLLHQGQCMQLTVDHSYLNELIRTGTIAVENAATVDLKGMESVITRAIGVSPTVDPDFFAVDIAAGDIVLLASDGLTRYIGQEEIGQMVRCTEIPLAAQSLIALAKQRGGADNITTLLLHIIPAA
jgi:protein phosphatase